VLAAAAAARGRGAGDVHGHHVAHNLLVQMNCEKRKFVTKQQQQTNKQTTTTK